VNLGIARVVIVVALAAAGISVLVGGFSGSVASSPDASGSVSPTVSPTSTGTPTPGAPPPTPAPNTSGVSFAVLNGTTVAGLAGDFETFLEGRNYLVGKDADDSPIKPIGETTVYFRGGDDAKQNRADAAHVARRYINGPGVKAKIQALGPEFASTLTGPGDNQVVLLIVLGTDYADAQSN
jgi:LytR cell envelope-related transcriptional attenuator